MLFILRISSVACCCTNSENLGISTAHPRKVAKMKAKPEGNAST